MSTSPEAEPLHPLITALVTTLGAEPKPMDRAQAAALLADFALIPDEDLLHALESLERLAAYCHMELKAVDLAAQLVDLCYDTTPILVAATERLNAQKLERTQKRRQQFATMTGGAEPARAPSVELKRAQTVETLRPKTKFV